MEEWRSAGCAEWQVSQFVEYNEVEPCQAFGDLSSLAFSNSSNSRLDVCTYVESHAYVFAQPAVKARLKAPSPASFPWGAVLSKHTGNCQFEVLGEVDAQNSFGAMTRSSFAAAMSFDPDTKTWSVKKVWVD